jgi:hypothetical protein
LFFIYRGGLRDKEKKLKILEIIFISFRFITNKIQNTRSVISFFYLLINLANQKQSFLKLKKKVTLF